MRSRFRGLWTLLDRSFLENYIGVDFHQCHMYEVPIELEARARLGFALGGWKWRNYQWVESFFEKVEQNFDKSYFMEYIHWKAARTVRQIILQGASGKKKRSDLRFTRDEESSGPR
jgi:hypothetical protein